jgi:hypothetical protein
MWIHQLDELAEQETSETSVKLLVQLKLHEALGTQFGHFDVTIPFFGRGRLAVRECSASVGSTALHPTANALVWSLAPKLAVKGVEASLSATIAFASEPIITSVHMHACMYAHTAYSLVLRVAV